MFEQIFEIAQTACGQKMKDLIKLNYDDVVLPGSN